MEEQRTVQELLYRWLDAVMADKVFYTVTINNKLVKDIGLEDNTLNNSIRIIKTAARALCGQKLSSGSISNILIEKKKGLWQMIVFKEKRV